MRWRRSSRGCSSPAWTTPWPTRCTACWARSGRRRGCTTARPGSRCSAASRPIRSPRCSSSSWPRAVCAEIYEADYGTLRQEILDPDSGLYRSRPDFLVVATTWRDLGHRPELSDDRGVVARKVEAEAAEWTSLWGIAHDRLGCQIIQNNFDAPPWRALGNLEATHPAGFGRYVSLVNHALQDAAPPYVTIHDVDHLAAAWGRWEWGDERFYHQAKLPCSPEHLVQLRAQPRLADPRAVGAGQEVPGPRLGQHALGRRDRRRRPGGFGSARGTPRARRSSPSSATPRSSADAA